MFKVFYSFLFVMTLLLCSCGVKVYKISEKSFTVLDLESNRRYVDVAKIAAIPAGEAVFQLELDSLFLRNDKELALKSGWTLRGKTGQETLIKEPSTVTSAIRIQQADGIVIEHLRIKTIRYISASDQALVLIDNEPTKQQGIEINNLYLTGHYSGITVLKGTNIKIEDCELFDNAHQIFLGEVLANGDSIKNRIDNVQILRTKITDSKQDSCNGIDGIQMRSICTNILISGCQIERNGGDAIDLYPGGIDVEIIDNDLSYNNVHGVEVKMDEKFPLKDTGLPRRVFIYGNRMVKNGNNGIRIFDSPGTNYAQGIEVRNNYIDSSGHYGIETRLPAVIDSNYLKANGLTIQNTKPDVGYTGIYLLNIIRPGKIEVTNNQIIDQAPINTTVTTYWISLNNIAPKVTLEGNDLRISESYLDSFTVAPYGISLISLATPLLVDSVRNNNTFSSEFTSRVVDPSQPSQY